MLVNPGYTSQRCPRCGSVSKNIGVPPLLPETGNPLPSERGGCQFADFGDDATVRSLRLTGEPKTNFQLTVQAFMSWKHAFWFIHEPVLPECSQWKSMVEK